MEEVTQKKVQQNKPDNMSEEQRIDYKYMSAHTGKMVKTMTGSFYSPSKEERAYFKKWQSESDKKRIQQNTTDYFIRGFIIFALFMLISYIFS